MNTLKSFIKLICTLLTDIVIAISFFVCVALLFIFMLFLLLCFILLVPLAISYKTLKYINQKINANKKTVIN